MLKEIYAGRSVAVVQTDKYIVEFSHEGMTYKFVSWTVV